MTEVLITLIIGLTVMGSIFLWKMCDGEYTWYGLHCEQEKMKKLLDEMKEVLDEMKKESEG